MQRANYEEDIRKQFRVHPACALLGPRQVGKTTLAKMFLESHPPEAVRRFDLEKSARSSKAGAANAGPF